MRKSEAAEDGEYEPDGGELFAWLGGWGVGWWCVWTGMPDASGGRDEGGRCVWNMVGWVNEGVCASMVDGKCVRACSGSCSRNEVGRGYGGGGYACEGTNGGHGTIKVDGLVCSLRALPAFDRRRRRI